MRIGVLTGGGDCPGLNAVIRSVTKSLINLCDAQVLGIRDGFAGLMEQRIQPLDWPSVSGILSSGGTILGTSNRANPLASAESLALALENYRALALDALIAIGGDGTMTIAQALVQRGMRIIGIPKTIDNDIEGCERSFGFDTAVNTVTQALDRVQTTGQSQSRVMIVETMGRYAGWIALEAGIAGAADIILLPEFDFDLDRIVATCRERENRERYTMICIGEGAKCVGGALTVEQRIESSPEPIRLGGVAHVLRAQLQPHLKSEVRATVLGHVQRGGSPTPFDRVLATRYGNEAAQRVRAGEFNCMVTLAQNQITAIALGQVSGRNRRIPAAHALLTTARQIGIGLGH